jgi:hypothetical protein
MEKGELGENEKLDRTGKEETPGNVHLSRRCVTARSTGADPAKMVGNGIKALKGR